MINRLARPALVLSLLAATIGCNKKEVIDKPTAPPAATFTGPAYLNGTVGSMTSRRGFAPRLVSGYGLVVNLPGTGSPDVPAFLRQEMINRLRREGFGSRRAGLGALTPETVLESEDTALVAVEGFIPPGATEGTRFDVLVSALPQTGTTNLEGGYLRTVEMSLFGTNEQRSFSRTLAKARGAMYLQPFDATSTEQAIYQQNLQAVVIGGGVVTEPSVIELVLNQPSWTRSSQIADRINEVFRKDGPDRNPTAVAKTDVLIQINIPSRYAHDPARFLDLVDHVYTQRGPTFEMEQARRLGEVAALSPREARRVSLAWQTLGKRALEVIRSYYNHENITVRLAALSAGVRLDDQLAADPLMDLSQHEDAQIRHEVAVTLGYLQNSLRGTRVLMTLVDDADTRVRIAAYESLVMLESDAIQRHTFLWDKQPKFDLDIVPATRPLIYINIKAGPRVVIFNGMTGFKEPLMAKLWDNQLMLRGSRDPENKAMTVFYQEQGKPEPQVHQIAPTVGNLIFLLAHESTVEAPTPGFNLPFSRVVNVLHTLCGTGEIQAPLHIDQSPLAAQIAQARGSAESQPAGGTPRPLTSPNSDSSTEPATQPTGSRRPMSSPR